MVPKALRPNLKWRRQLIRRGSVDPDFAMDMWRMCARDPLFFVNSFCWLHEPRGKRARVMPFITYPFQDEVIAELVSAMGFGEEQPHDVGIEKSRDMGLSWMLTTVFGWAWLFKPNVSLMLVSRKEVLVDNGPGDSDTLFWKLRFQLKRMPGWMVPKHDSVRLRQVNLENGSTIDGESTTGDVGRGGRRTAIGLDEFASFESVRPGSGDEALAATRDNTRCRIFNSTPKGTGVAFYQRVVKNPAIRTIQTHWTQHPLKRRGMYRADKKGRLEILDEQYQFPPDYPFVLDGRVRSPWYDAEEARAGSRQEIAQELDIDHLAAGSQFYDEEILRQVLRDDVRAPFYETNEVLDMLPKELAKNLEVGMGQRMVLRLWVPVDKQSGPPPGEYGMGIDVSAGSDRSNSVVSIGNLATGEKVASFSSTKVLPHDLATWAAVLGRWFGGKHEFTDYYDEIVAIWEARGPGITFGRSLMDTEKYRTVYYRPHDEESISPRATNKPGWAPTSHAIDVLHGEYRRALGRRTFVNHDRKSIELCREYVVGEDGHVKFGGRGRPDAQTGARHNHGDEVVADALLNKLMMERPAVNKAERPEAPVGSFGWRRQKRVAAAATKDLW